MAKAVENSYCVILCVTESYRQSVYCQAEAKYAFKLGKPIIVLFMDAGSEKRPDGWLGQLITDNIPTINMSKRNQRFEEYVAKIKEELSLLLNRGITRRLVGGKDKEEPVASKLTVKDKNEDEGVILEKDEEDDENEEASPSDPREVAAQVIAPALSLKTDDNGQTEKTVIPVNNLPVTSLRKKFIDIPVQSESGTVDWGQNVEYWSDDDVKECLLSMNIDQMILDKILPCDGAVLKQLYDIKHETPQYYVQLLDKESQLEIRSVLAFNTLLDKLFSKN